MSLGGTPQLCPPPVTGGRLETIEGFVDQLT
jgi:hypothetical protein